MAAIDFSRFHELAEQFRGEMSLKKICEQEGVPYRRYIAWRSREGLSSKRKSSSGESALVEIAMDEGLQSPEAPKATAVHIEFENGLRFDRSGMDVDTLIRFLTKLKGALCLG